MLYEEAQFVQAFQQTGLGEAVHVEVQRDSVEGDSLLGEIDGELGVRKLLHGVQQLTVLRGVKLDDEHAVFQGILLEDIGKRRRDQDAKSEVPDRPDGMFARAARTEIGTRNENLALTRIGNAENLGRLEVHEQQLAESGLVDLF